jgi:hypothetical protein
MLCACTLTSVLKSGVDAAEELPIMRRPRCAALAKTPRVPGIPAIDRMSWMTLFAARKIT